MTFAKRVFTTVLLVLFIISSQSSAVFAAETDSSYVTEGNYSFTSNELANKQIEDHFTFREDCFMRSSFLGCNHLLELSAQLAIASASRYGDQEDKYEIDPSNNGENVVNLLAGMGFQDVETNRYYDLEKLEDSCAAAVGHREIKAFGETYTLIAIAPRSALYKQEWVGNFNVGKDDMHAGFKAARDEVLRFVKQYINEHGITGKLKVWTAGHSRGSAVASMIGGFFAGGGIAYFGDGVSITPEDVYCYAYAVPRTIKPNLSKNTELSVAGARGDDYPDDTPGEAYSYSGGGSVDPRDPVYGGIRNIVADYDFIGMLPPDEWGYTYYGEVLPLGADVHSKEVEVAEDVMAAELAALSPYAYNRYIKDGDHRKFSWKTFDLLSLKLVDDEAYDAPVNDMGGFMSQRIRGLVRDNQTTDLFVDQKNEETLKAIAGLYGLLLNCFDVPENLEEISLDGIELGPVLKPVIFSYLAYAADLLQKEGRAADEKEGAALVIAGLLASLTGKEIDPGSYTLDDTLYDVSKLLSDNPDSELHKTVVTGIAGALSKVEVFGTPVSEILKNGFASFDPNYDAEADNIDDLSFEEVLGAFLKAMAYGADPSSQAYKDNSELADPQRVRKMLYGALGLALVMLLPEVQVSDVLGEETDGKVPLRDLVPSVLPALLTKEDEEGTVIERYDTLAEAADGLLPDAVDLLMKDALAIAAENYPPAYMADVERHLNNMKAHITETRKILMNILFYVEGEEYSTEADLRKAATFIGNVGIIPLAHYNEVYIAWPRAIATLGCPECDHSITHVSATEATCTQEGVREHWLYHESTGDRYFTDRILSAELTEAETVLAKKEHDWGPWKVTREATVNREGEETRVCRICGEKETRPVPKLAPAKPEKDQQSGKSQNSAGADTGKPAQSASAPPRTGDTSAAAVYAGLFGMALLSLILIAARAKRSQTK